MKIGYAPKTEELKNGEKLHFWYANNRKRADSNCTIIRTKNERAAVSVKQTGILAETRTSSWKGFVNFSKKVQSVLGV